MIVDGLRQDDLLSQWMAHHIAERMAALDHVAAESRRQAEDDLAALILRLWAHGRSSALSEDPTRLSDSVVRAVAKLDPEPGEPYYRAFGFFPRHESTGTELDEYLRVALSLDHEVQRLILHLVNCAAALAEDQEAEWIKQLQKVDADPLVLIRDLTNYSDGDSLDDQTDPLEARKESVARQAAAVRELLDPLARQASGKPAVKRPRRVASDD